MSIVFNNSENTPVVSTGCAKTLQALDLAKLVIRLALPKSFVISHYTVTADVNASNLLETQRIPFSLKTLTFAGGPAAEREGQEMIGAPAYTLQDKGLTNCGRVGQRLRTTPIENPTTHLPVWSFLLISLGKGDTTGNLWYCGNVARRVNGTQPQLITKPPMARRLEK